MAAGFRAMLERDRKTAGFSVGQVAWRLGVSPAEYGKLEDGERYPNFGGGTGSASCTGGRDSP